MRTTLKLIATGALLVASACSSKPAPTTMAKLSPSVAAPSPIPTVAPAEARFVEMLRQRFAMTDEESQRAVAAARLICTDLDGGMTLDELNTQIVVQRVDPIWAASVVGYGIGAFCPQHLGQLE